MLCPVMAPVLVTCWVMVPEALAVLETFIPGPVSAQLVTLDASHVRVEALFALTRVGEAVSERAGPLTVACALAWVPAWHVTVYVVVVVTTTVA